MSAVRHELPIILSIFSLTLAAIAGSFCTSPASDTTEYLYLETPAGGIGTYRIEFDGSKDAAPALPEIGFTVYENVA
jgi:hypothetical protein